MGTEVLLYFEIFKYFAFYENITVRLKTVRELATVCIFFCAVQNLVRKDPFQFSYLFISYILSLQ